MILETFSQDGEWGARQVDYVRVTKQNVVQAGTHVAILPFMLPDDYVLIAVLTDTRQPLRIIVDSRRNTQSRYYVDVPEEE